MKKYILIIFCMLTSLSMWAQNRVVSGNVTSPDGEAIIGATIRVEGTTKAVVTDIDGNFKIEAGPNDKISISYIGSVPQTVTATQNIKVTLQNENTDLEEVVVIGYGTQKKATLTGAVSSVNSKEIVVTKNENVVNMLSGKIPGVRITQNSASPGDYDNNIDIRGMGTPLIVVDGIPRDKDYFSRMDASEIDNVSVLKDASAAIYGVRAANGVILVTTKRGSSVDGKVDITFSANFGWQSFLYLPNTASATDFMLMYNEKANNAFGSNTYPNRTGQGNYTYEDMFKYSSAGNFGTDWTGEMFDKTSPQQQYNVSVNGSSKSIDYYFNLGYMDQMGSYKSGSLNYDRWNFRANVDARITDRLKVSVSLSGYMDEKNQPFTDIWAVYKKAWTYRPTSEAWIGGDHNLPGYDSQMLESDNPVAITNSKFTGYRQAKRQDITGTLALEYQVPWVKGLSAKAFYSYDNYYTNNTDVKKAYDLFSRNPDGTLNTYGRNNPATVRRSTDPNWATDMQLSLNYSNTFGDHNVSAFVMFEEQYNTWDNFYAQRNMMLNSIYLLAGEEEGQLASMTGVGDKLRQAWVGRVHYDYLGRYMIDASFREDGSSSFGKGARWGFFPSASVGWRVSEEAWAKKYAPFVTNFKLRASYGKLGDDGSASNYPPIYVGYEIKNNDYGWFYSPSLTPGLQPTAIPNPNLTWYTAEIMNFGVDFDLWNGLLGGTFEMYKRNRDGLLATSSVVLPGTVGANMPQENMNADQTYGWEVLLTHRNSIADFNYSVMAQVSATKNRWNTFVDSRAGNSMEAWYRRDVSGRNKDIWFAYEEGGRFSNYEQIQNHPLVGANYDRGTLPGDYWYEDWNGDGVVNDQDKHPMATFNLPVFNYGISLAADWRGIDLAMDWAGAAGVYNAYNEVFAEVEPFNGGALLDIYLDRWHTANVDDDPWNPNTKWVEGFYPATGHQFNTGSTAIRNTSYIRLKTLELGYTLPKKWMSAAGIGSLRVYVNAYNLLTISGLKGMDPERPGAAGGINTNNNGALNSILFYNYPVNRTFNVGATLKF